MSTTPPAIQNLARRLLASEPARVGSSHGDADQAVLACERLRVPLTKLVGTAAFASLLTRALALASRQAPSLQGLRVGADGLLTGFNEVQQDSGTVEPARDWGAVLVTELLGLLVTLIGQPLTLNLVREAWPDASLETLTLSDEETP